MDVNENAGRLDAHGALETIASRLAPTGFLRQSGMPGSLWELACQRWAQLDPESCH